MQCIQKRLKASETLIFSKTTKFIHWINNGMNPVGVLLFIFAVTFIFLTQSPLFFLRNAPTTTDSSVFITVARTMKDGGMPYLDSFDHKGPLLFILNYLGVIISFPKGIWLIEFIFNYITFCFMYKIARLVCDRTLSLFCVFCGISLLMPFFEVGNFVEEYAMAFISVSLYIFLDYFINEIITNLRLAACGFCLGCVCLLRPNMISVWIVFSIAVLIQIIQHKSWENLRRFIIPFAGGLLLILVPIVIWLALNHALSSCIEQYILFNFKYSSDAERASLSNRWHSFLFFSSPTLVLLPSAVSVWMCSSEERRDKSLGVIYFSYLLTTSLLICLSGQQYGHYGMILVPAIVFPMAKLTNELKCSKKSVKVKLALAFYFSVMIIIPNVYTMIHLTGHYVMNPLETEYPIAYIETAAFIDANSEEYESISVYGNRDIIYILSNRNHATKYSYQFPIGKIDQSIMDDYFSQLKNEKPALIIVQEINYDDEIKYFLEQNHYNFVWSSNTETNLSEEALYDEFMIFKR